MQVISYTTARGNLAKTMTKVCQDHDPVVITRRDAKAVVMLSLEDYDAMCETTYLLKSPRNAKRLLSSIEELNKGKGKVKDLME